MDQTKPTPPIREVWNALTHPGFLIDPQAARAYEYFMRRLKAVLENGEEGIAWGITVLESASRLMNNTMYEEAALKRHLGYLYYVRRNAAKIAAYGAAQHARLGSGIVAINWPSSDFPSTEDAIDGVEYITKETWRLRENYDPDAGPPPQDDLEGGGQILQALEEYDPSRQVVIIFSNDQSQAADAMAATFIYEFPPESDSPGEVNARIRSIEH